MADSVNDRMRWTSALSTRPSLEAALSEVVERAQQSLQSTPDLAMVFISAAYASEYSRLMPLLKEELSVPALIGCSGTGVIGVNDGESIREVEDEPALTLCLAHLPNVRVHAFHLAGDDLPDLDSPPQAWIDLVGVAPEEHPHFILLADPFTSRINDLLQGLDFAYPSSVKVGGLASGATMMGSSGLFCNYRRYQEGVVGLAVSGQIVMEAIVAQGCRPIGQTLRVLEGERNILLQVEEPAADGSPGSTRTPLEVLQSIFQDLSEEDRRLAQHSLFVGIARSEFKADLEQGDFLIRNLLGVDPRNGAIAIGDRVRSGQRIQFHLRDATTSAEDLEVLLRRYQRQVQTNQASPLGALMFSCTGRGAGLYGEPDFDSSLFHRYIYSVPLSGFFCGGEIGPVGDTTFLHGYTSVFAICREP